MLQKRKISTLIIGILLIQTGVKGMNKFDEKLSINAESFKLKNGLKVIVHEDNKAPVVSVSVWYGVGSKDEVYTQKGLAHLIEHLLFQGSANNKSDYIEAVEELGPSELNGTTGRDRTNYYQTVPRQALDRILWMEADRMGYFAESITQEKLDEQRGVVINELHQGDNQPYGKVWKNIIHNTFPKGHPYSWRTIGSEKDLKEITVKNVQNWFKNLYGAGNAVLVLSGDITTEEARVKVEKYFGHLASGPAISTVEKWIPEIQSPIKFKMKDDVPQDRFYKVWNIPGLGELDAEKLNLVSDVLSVGKKSRFYQRLMYKDKLTTGVSAFVWLSQLSGQFIIQGTAKPGVNLKEIEDAINDELDKFIKYGPTHDELSRVKSQYKAHFIRSLETIGASGGKAKILAEGELYFNDIHAYKKIYETRQNAKEVDLKNAAKLWLSKPAFTLYVETHDTINRDNTKTIEQAPKIDKPKKLNLPKGETFKLKNNLKVTFIKNTTVPILRFSLITPLGFAQDPDGKKGLTKLTSEIIDEGTKHRDIFKIAEDIERIGAKIGTGSDLDDGSISLTTLKETLDQGLDIYSDIILNPTFPEKELKRIKELQLAHIEQEKASPINMALRQMPMLLYKDHPYSVPFTGTGFKKDVEKITQKDVSEHYKTIVQPENCHLFVVGDIEKSELKNKLEHYFREWKATTESKPEMKLPTTHNRPKIVLIDKPGSTQSVVMAGRLIAPLGKIDEIKLETFENILGGTFGSRLNMNLREDKHWTYGAHTHLPDAKGQRPLLAYSQVQQDKTVDSMIEITKELTEIILERPITKKELEKAKKSQIQSLPSILETQGKLLSSIIKIHTNNLPLDFYETYQENVEKITTAQLTELGESILGGEQWTWVIIGDAKVIEKDIQQLKWGKVERVEL